MNKYRIVKEENHKGVLYFIQRKRKFLFWTYWTDVEAYRDIEERMDFPSKEKAQECIDRLEYKTKQTVVSNEDD